MYFSGLAVRAANDALQIGSSRDIRALSVGTMQSPSRRIYRRRSAGRPDGDRSKTHCCLGSFGNMRGLTWLQPYVFFREKGREERERGSNLGQPICLEQMFPGRDLTWLPSPLSFQATFEYVLSAPQAANDRLARS